MIEYHVNYHRTLRDVIETATIAIDGDAYKPAEDAADIANMRAKEIGASFFVLYFPTKAESVVIWTNYASPSELK